MEAETVTGPAKNLLQFCRAVHPSEPPLSPDAFPVQATLATFYRGSADPPPPSPFILAARRSGIPIHVLTESRRFDISILGQLRDLIASVSPDIIQTHGVKSHSLLRWLRPPGLPWIAFHHGYTTTDLKMRLYNQLNRWSLPGADRVITVCQAFAIALSAAGVSPAKLRVQHNSITPPAPVSESEIEALRQNLRLAPAEAPFLTIGRFSREKGHADLIEAYALLPPTVPRLVLLGEGPERPLLEAAIRRHGLQSRLLLPGHGDPRPYYAIASACLLPSHSEGSPNVLLEAMAQGLPTVATTVGGVPEIASPDHAFLCPPRNPPALAEAIRRLLADPAAAATMGRLAKVHVLTNFTPAQQHLRLLSVYRELSGPIGTAASFR